ncbi:MAG TPA: protein translocase subunit SecD [Streptosporangiaceae bacterium]|nr:protein translocase subunit SecD [Streptosporangiaceae bacterium]
MAPPSGSASPPGRMLAALAAVIVVLLLAILGGDIIKPTSWHNDFKVKLGLDLTQGTEVTLAAVTPKGKPASQSEMTQAIQIMQDRVNGAGFTETQVQQQGSDIINVSIPGQENEKVVQLVSQTAELVFRQVLIQEVNNLPATPTPTPTPSGTPSPSPSGTASPGASSTPTPAGATTPTPTPSSSAQAAGAPGAATGTHEMAYRTSRLTAKAAEPQASASAGATPPAAPSSAATPPASPAGTPPAAASAGPACPPVPKDLTPAKGTATWQDALASAQLGVPSLVWCHTKALFNHVNCAAKNWPGQVGYTLADLNGNDNSQVVSCAKSGGVWYKYALAPVSVHGAQVSGASATPIPSNVSQWQVLLNFTGSGATAFGNITTAIFDKYHCVANQPCPANGLLAAVLDGTVISPSAIDAAITGGSAQISPFTQAQAETLQQQLSYGKLPLTFNQQQVVTVSPQLGHDQLNAGLIAAGIGLFLVICYLLFYYRGLAVVAVSSLVIAGLLTYLAVVTLGKYAGFALNLAGVAGLIVAIGITADSFVVFFERLRDEVREGGRSLRAAVERGWQRARRTILVSDTVSFIAAALLYYFSIGDVKGFAFTLGLITIIDVMVVFTFTKPMLTLLARTKFFGGGHPLSGLDPARLGARAPWRGTPRPVATRGARTSTAQASRPGAPKEA